MCVSTINCLQILGQFLIRKHARLLMAQVPKPSHSCCKKDIDILKVFFYIIYKINMISNWFKNELNIYGCNALSQQLV